MMNIWLVAVWLGVVQIVEAKPSVVRIPVRRDEMRGKLIRENVGNLHDIVYRGRIEILSQQFDVVFDTGSDLLWVPGRGCNSSGPHAGQCAHGTQLDLRDDPPNGNPRPQRRASSRHRFRIEYGRGWAEGIVHRLNVRVDRLLLEDVDVGVASQIDYMDYGVFGLSLPDPGGRTPVFVEAFERGVFASPLITAFIRKCDRKCSDGGRITLGGEDADNCGSVESWTNVTGKGPLWQFDVANFTVIGEDGRKFERQLQTDGISDTGTSYIQFPKSLYPQVLTALNTTQRDGYQLVPCDSKLKIGFRVAEMDIWLNEQTLILNQGFGPLCVLAIGKSVDEILNLGDPFIRSRCHVFDVQRRRVGFASVLNKS